MHMKISVLWGRVDWCTVATYRRSCRLPSSGLYCPGDGGVYSPHKTWYLYTNLHGVIFCKAGIVIGTAMLAANVKYQDVMPDYLWFSALKISMKLWRKFRLQHRREVFWTHSIVYRVRQPVKNERPVHCTEGDSSCSDYTASSNSKRWSGNEAGGIVKGHVGGTGKNHE